MLDLAGIRSGLLAIVRSILRLPVQAEAGALQPAASLIEQAAGEDVMRHALADPLAARLPGMRRHQAERFHLVGPLAIVVTAAARVAEMELPLMNLFMHQD